MNQSDPIIRTKLHMPFTRHEQVLRPRLKERIAQGLRGPLTLVTAPAGFGKTTLVASCIAGYGMPVAWLSLDKDDNQVERFLNYLVAALHEVDKTIGSQAAGHQGAAYQGAPEEILTYLVNDLEAAGREIALVLDDYQFIRSQPVHDQVAFLLDHCPRNFHLVIATRSDPPLPLTRLRVRGEMVELRAADLRFTQPETALFLNEVMGLNLDAGSVRVLEARTEGWIAGLQMAALSIRGSEDVPGFIAGFSGTNRFILDYLVEEVLSGQPPEIQRFLLRTSVLERLSAPLCDAILVPDGEARWDGSSQPTESEAPLKAPSSAILASLEQENLFLVPLDDERTWYRYHHLFADLLRAQLHKSLGAQGMAQLHIRASDWFAQLGSILEAISHASLAADDARVEQLIEANYMQMVNQGEMSMIRYWMGKLSEESIHRRPWLCLYEALSRSWFGQLEEATLLLDQAEIRIRAQGSATGVQSMRGYHAFVKSRVTAMQGDMPRAIELCNAACEGIPAENLALQNEVAITLGYEYFLHGDFERAERILGEMIRSGAAARAINNPVAGYAILARMRIYQGKLQEASDLLQQSDRLIAKAGGQHLGVSGLLKVEDAALLYERNDLETALASVKQGLDLLAWWGKADDLCLGYCLLSRILIAQGNLADAEGALEKAAHLLQTRGIFQEARHALAAAWVHLWLAQGDGFQVDRWLAARQVDTVVDGRFTFENELAGITLARAWIARGKTREVIKLLPDLEKSARSAGRVGRVITIVLLESLAYHASHDSEAAFSALAKCLALAQSEGYVRTFLDEGQPLRVQLARWLAEDSDHPRRDYARHLLAHFEAEPSMMAKPTEKVPPVGPPSGTIEPPLFEPLSPRELEVLQLIAQGNTNQAIARQLVISPGTVKAHTASIYRKLDVANRTEASARARQLGYIS